MLKDKIVNTLACRHCLFSYLSRILIAYHRIEGCNHSEAVVDILAALFRICRDSFHTVYAEGVKAVHQNLCRLEAALRHYRFHCIELHLGLL